MNPIRKCSQDVVSQLAVVTGLKRPPNPVHSYANQEAIDLHKWPTGNVGNSFDIGVVVSFSHLIPESIITSFPMYDLQLIVMSQINAILFQGNDKPPFIPLTAVARRCSNHLQPEIGRHDHWSDCNEGGAKALRRREYHPSAER